MDAEIKLIYEDGDEIYFKVEDAGIDLNPESYTIYKKSEPWEPLKWVRNKICGCDCAGGEF